MTKKEILWKLDVGFPPYRVTVFENEQRDRVIYLRWREMTPSGKRNWRVESLSLSLLDPVTGKKIKAAAVKAVMETAIGHARNKYQDLLSGSKNTTVETKRQLKISDAWDLVSDRAMGAYPVDTPHRREVKRALTTACKIWGSNTLWDEINRSHLTKLGRTRIDELAESKNQSVSAGYRGAEITVTRVLTVAKWLRDEGHIRLDACVPRDKWKADLRGYWSQARGAVGSIPVHRPRFTIEESRALLDASYAADPRLHLLLALGAELRAGQVARTRRSHVDLEKDRVSIPGAGKKRGEVVHLTEGQKNSLLHALADGYLRDLETAFVEGEIQDYPLFPMGQISGLRTQKASSKRDFAKASKEAAAKPSITSSGVRFWFREAHRIAKVSPVKGRGPYGLRRAGVDEGKRLNISREGLQKLGGWSDSQVPDRIYADQEAEYARDEARDIRAKIRGEVK